MLSPTIEKSFYSPRKQSMVSFLDKGYNQSCCLSLIAKRFSGNNVWITMGKCKTKDI